MTAETEGLVVKVEDSAGSAVITVAGTLDYWSADALRKPLEAAIAVRAPQVVLDLAQVSFVDSTGLAMLIAADHWTQERGGWLRLAQPSKQLQRLLRTTNFDRRLGIYRSVADALGDSGGE